ncbi:MAG: SDR family oxidoreductase [Caldithrix sp.]|nr:SDR family oxidoreductase [Caldithrix sp.]
MDLKDKVAIVTGGAVRLGAAITRELAESGVNVMCHFYSSQQAATELKQGLGPHGTRVHLFQYDLMRPDAPKAIVTETLRVFSTIDVLINNAALFYRTPLGKVTENDWDTFHNLNLKSAFFLSQEVSQILLKKKQGKIINIGDAGAEAPFPGYIPYSLTKAGIMAMTKGLAKALAPHIQVNCINPGPVLFPEDMSDRDKNYALEQTLLKREGTDTDIARTVRFLLQDSDFITGAVIPVDGGRQIR